MNRYWVIALQAIVTLALGAAVFIAFLSPDESGEIREIDARRGEPQPQEEPQRQGRSQKRQRQGGSQKRQRQGRSQDRHPRRRPSAGPSKDDHPAGPSSNARPGPPGEDHPARPRDDDPADSQYVNPVARVKDAIG